MPILYGFPLEDGARAAARGEVVLGGDVLRPGRRPTHACTACGHRWTRGRCRLPARR